jgi:hypothetical protein
MAFFDVPALDGSGRLPVNVRTANAATDEFRMQDSLLPVVTTLPTASAEKIRGRQVLLNSDNTVYVSDGTNWRPIGATSEIGWGQLGSVGPNFYMDGASTIYAFRNGRAIDFRFRFGRTSGSLVAGDNLYQMAAMYVPFGNGDTVLNAVQRAGTGTPTPIACYLTGSGTIFLGTPASTMNQVHVQGRFYLP